MDEGIIPDPFLLAENSHVRRCGPKGGAWEREDESEGGNPEINLETESIERVLGGQRELRLGTLEGGKKIETEAGGYPNYLVNSEFEEAHLIPPSSNPVF